MSQEAEDSRDISVVVLGTLRCAEAQLLASPVVCPLKSNVCSFFH